MPCTKHCLPACLLAAPPIVDRYCLHLRNELLCWHTGVTWLCLRPQGSKTFAHPHKNGHLSPGWVCIEDSVTSCSWVLPPPSPGSTLIMPRPHLTIFYGLLPKPAGSMGSRLETFGIHGFASPLPSALGFGAGAGTGGGGVAELSQV